MNSKITPTKLSYVLSIPKIKDEGYLYFAESDNHIPFPIKRIYFISDIYKNAIRGKHAHKKTQQILFCIKGSVKIVLHNGLETEEITLTNAEDGIFLDKMMWHEMKNFSKDTLLLVLASDYYKESDYIRDFTEFMSGVYQPSPVKRNMFASAVQLVRRSVL